MIKKYRHIFYELILLFASVFVFRSLWTLMDSVEFFSHPAVHVILLVIGIWGTIAAVNGLAPKNWWDRS